MLAELPGLKGEGLLVKTDTIEPLQQEEIIALFNEQRQPAIPGNCQENR